MTVPLRYPEYWARVASDKICLVTWLKAVSEVEPAFFEKTLDDWARIWGRELLEATMFYAKAGKVDVVEQISRCHLKKPEHIRSARRWFNKVKQAETEASTADVGDHVVRAIEILQPVGKAFPKGTTLPYLKRTITPPPPHRARRQRKSFKVVDSEGNAVSPLVIKTPPSSPPAPLVRDSSLAATADGTPRMSFSAATAEKVERRMLKACQHTVDTIVAAHLPSLQTKDFGTRVHEIRKSLRPQMRLFNQDSLEWDSNMDLFADIRNVHAHVRPHWPTDWAVLSGVIKTRHAVAKFGDPDSIKKVDDHVLFVLATLRKHNPGPLPHGATAIKFQGEIKELSDIPPAPVERVLNVLGPLLSNAEAELRAHVQRNAQFLPRISTKDLLDSICEKLITIQRRQAAACSGVPEARLPIQGCFPGLREGGKISILVRWLRVLLCAFSKLSSGQPAVRIECAVTFAIAVWELLVTIGRDPRIAEEAVDGLLAIFLAKGNLVSISRDELTGDCESDDSELFTSDSNKEHSVDSDDYSDGDSEKEDSVAATAAGTREGENKGVDDGELLTSDSSQEHSVDISDYSDGDSEKEDSVATTAAGTREGENKGVDVISDVYR